MTVRVSVWKQYRLHFISTFMASLLSLSVPKPSLLTTKATAATTTTTVPSPPDTLSLDQKFGRKGIKFSEPGGDAPPTVELTVRNGSSVKLQISNAHVTSYKPKVYWKDDGFEEILYTIPPSFPTTNVNSKGGIGLVINNVTGDPKSKGSSPVDISQWDVKDVDSDSIDAVQVELSCITSGTLDITYVISLYPLCMATAVLVKNNGTKPVDLTSAILSHFKFKKRNLTGIGGLQRCSFCVMPPLSSPFEILSPAEAMKTEELNWISSFGWDPEKKPGSWGVQDLPMTILRHKLSRVYGAHPEERLKEFYNTTPSKYETLDQGKELFFRVIRMGYDDIYLSSPGSMAKKYGKGYFICTGPASMLVPITVDPGQQWSGAQVIEHDNL